MNRAETANGPLNTLQMVALVVGVVGVALLGLGFAINPEQFFRSYLFGFLFSISVPLGCLGFMMLHHMTGGTWGLTVRRMFEAGALTLPLMALLFAPIALTLLGFFGDPGILYHWANPEVVRGDPILEHKTPYLNVPFFLARTAGYFLIWALLAVLLRNWSIQQDRTGNVGLVQRMRMVSAPGIVLFVLTVSFAAFDWGMTLDPHWFSTIYGVMFLVGDGLFTLAFLIVMVGLLINREPMAGVVSTKQVHDLGKLMLAFTVLWAYVSFAQYLIIWSGNIAEFTPWYVRRTAGGWEWFTVVLILFHFLVPFFLLLSRRNKQKLSFLMGIALWMIVMRLLDLSWVILPEFHSTVANVSWMDFAAPLGLFGIWLAVFLALLKRQPLLPANDPGMVDFAFGGHH